MTSPSDQLDDSQSVLVSADDGVLTISLNRPSRRNSLDQASVIRLVRVFEDAATDESLRVIHLRGVGENFCAGADWVAVNAAGGPKPRAAGMVRRTPLQPHRLIELIMEVQLPVVATVRGWAAGLGCHIALAADFTIAADDARFWEPFADRGFTPDSGGTWLLPRLIGLARARQMLLLGEKIPGEVAAAWGLIHSAVPADELDAAAADVVQRLACGPTVALGLTKQLLNRGLELPLEQALANESFGLEVSSRTGDFREGLKAFTERRPPDFTGR